MLVGMTPVPIVGVSAPTIYLGGGAASPDNGDIDLTGLDIGVASPDRVVVACLTSYLNSGGNITLPEFNGNSVSIYNGTSDRDRMAFAYANIPTGTTMDLFADLGGSIGYSYQLFSIYGLQSFTPEKTLSSAVDAGLITDDFVKNEVVIAQANNRGTYPDLTGTLGVEEDIQFDIQSGVNVSIGSLVVPESITGATVDTVNTTRQNILISFE